MEHQKQPWTNDLNEFISFLNPKSKSYEDVKKAITVAWEAAFNKYVNMLVIKDESPVQEEILKKEEKVLNWEEDYQNWVLIHNNPTAKEAWEEAYNLYVKMGHTQASIDEFNKGLSADEVPCAGNNYGIEGTTGICMNDEVDHSIPGSEFHKCPPKYDEEGNK